MKKEIKRINMTITPQLHRDAKIQCAKNETTLSKVVCQLLTEWLESQKQEQLYTNVYSYYVTDIVIM